MTVRGRQDGGRHGSSARNQTESTDSAGAWVFAVLAVLGLGAPALILRAEAVEVFGPGHPTPVSVPDTGPGPG
ncbi:hypothetical protein JNUCC64_24540 [Streptomyces sp. JNUCC 64]